MFKFNFDNFVPLTRTPWAGVEISKIKKKYFPDFASKIPDKIGESWEVSADYLYSSYILDTRGNKTKYSDVTSHHPLLLKWISTDDVLSVQVHPDNKNSLLKENECGKPEAWYIVHVQKNAKLYLGFKDYFTKEEIINCLKNNRADECLHSFTPNPGDYVSVPTGCVHAVGAGIFLVEPQLVSANKEGKTWRLFDWNRKYNDKGLLDSNGKLRELHMTEALSAIDWNLPRGEKLQHMLVKNYKHGESFLGNHLNPFCMKVMSQESQGICEPFAPQKSFLLVTVLGGCVEFSSGREHLFLHGGESAHINTVQHTVISFSAKNYQGEDPLVLFFSTI